MAPFGNVRAGEQAAGLAGMNALTGQRLDIQAVDHIDLLLQRLQRRQRLAELHVGALAFGAPVILIDAVAQEHHAEALGESRRRGVSARACRDSSQGSAMVQPAPRRTARREMRGSGALRASVAILFTFLRAGALGLSRVIPGCAGSGIADW